MKILQLIVIIVSLNFGLLIFIMSQTLLAALQMVVNAFVARKFYRVGIKAQIRVYLPYYLYCGAAGLAAYLLNHIPGLPPVVRLLASSLVFIGLYILQIYAFERKTFNDTVRLIRSGLAKLRFKPNGSAMNNGASI